MKPKFVCCRNCNQWFSYSPELNNGIEVKKRGYSSAYYCAECIANTKLTKRKEMTK